MKYFTSDFETDSGTAHSFLLFYSQTQKLFRSIIVLSPPSLSQQYLSTSQDIYRFPFVTRGRKSKVCNPHGGSYFSLSVSQICLQNMFTITHGRAIVETGSRYQYQYSMTLGCNTNININNKRSGFASSIPISILSSTYLAISILVSKPFSSNMQYQFQ